MGGPVHLLPGGVGVGQGGVGLGVVRPTETGVTLLRRILYRNKKN